MPRMVATRVTAAAMATEMVVAAVATVAMAVATMATMDMAVATTIATKTAAVESNMAMIRHQIQQQLEQRHKRMVVVFGRVQWEMAAPW